MLSKGALGTTFGLGFLIPELLKLGVWDLLNSWVKTGQNIFAPNMALQMINESALCLNGIRASRSLNHQGFEILNGLSFLASDSAVHDILDRTTIADTKKLQIMLGKIRKQLGDYPSNVYILDPHSIITHTRSQTPKKMIKKLSRSEKVLMTYFCIEADSGQPIGFLIGSSGRTVSNATKELIDMTLEINPEGGLIIADTEHSTVQIIEKITEEESLECFIPSPRNTKVKSNYNKIEYEESNGLWTGYSIGSTGYKLNYMEEQIRLVVQRTQEIGNKYRYKPFYSTEETTGEVYKKLATKVFRKRWTIEEFYNFESSLGWNRASTLNLNIRYGKMTMGLIAQAAIYRFRQKLPGQYRDWTAEHLANEIFLSTEGRIKVKDDKIILTIYNFPDEFGIKHYYEGLPEKLESQGINPKIPWLMDYKLDFRFK